MAAQFRRSNILLFAEDVPKAIEEIKAAIVRGEITQDEIDLRCKKLLMAKQWCGLDHFKPIKTEHLIEDLNTPSAKYLEINMIEFEKEILLKLPHVYKTKSILIKNIAMVHAELLFIHPFREGNGRVARILANMMSYKAGYNKIKFEELEDNILLQKKYIEGVQFAGIKDYKKMESIIKKIF